MIWFLASVSLAFALAASGYYAPLFLIAMIAAGVMMVIVVFSGSPANALLLVSVFVVAFNASYHPLFGMVSGFQGAPSGLYRIALGLRSGWAAAALVFVLGYAFFKSKKLRSEFLRPSLFGLFVIVVSLGLSHAPMDARVTYLLNSFIPLFASVCCVAAVFMVGTIAPVDARRVANIAIVGMVIGAVYFFLLPITYDFFRPDLGSFLRARPGTAIEYGSYGGAWGSRIYGYLFNRFVGTFPDPIMCGYFAACMSFALFVAGYARSAAILLVFLMITLSKGAWLMFFQASLFYWLLIFRAHWVVVAAAAVACVIAQLLLASVLEASSKIHLLGLIGGVTSVLQGGIKPLIIGFGIGEGGNLARAYVAGGALGAGWLGSGSESGVGVVLHQTGLLGAAALGYLTLKVFRVLLFDYAPTGRRRNLLTKDRKRLAAAALLLSLFVNMPLQENCINSSVLSILLLAVLLLSSPRVAAVAKSRQRIMPAS